MGYLAGFTQKREPTYDAIVFKSGTTVYSLDANGNPLATPTSTADRATIQTAIDYVEGLGGGEVFIKRSQYTMDGTSLTVDSDAVKITGSGYSTYLKKSSGSANPIIKFGDGTTNRKYCGLSWIRLGGIAASTRAVVMNEADYCRLEKIFYDTYSAASAIAFEITSTDAVTTGQEIVDCFGTATGAILINGATSTNRVTNVTVRGGKFFGVTATGKGIDIVNGYTCKILEAPNLSAFSKGIHVQSGNYNIISGRYENNTEDWDIDAGVTDTIVESSTYGTATVTDGGTRTKIRPSPTYLIENKGTGSIANGATSSGNIAHGLAYTPSAGEFSIVWTEDPTNSLTEWWISGIDATNFVVNRNDPGASGADFSWAVRKV